MWISAITIDGVVVPLEDWLAQLTIRHGRVKIYDPPTASTCTLALHEPPRELTRDLTIGAELKVFVATAPGMPPPVNRVLSRFVGRISDLAIDDPDLTLIATGGLAQLRRPNRNVSTAGWTAAPWSDTVERLLDACDVPLYAVHAAAFDPVLEPPPEAEMAVGGYLDELAATVGAAVYDDVDGRIVVDAVGFRREDASRLDPIGLDPLNVLYSPRWIQQDDVDNSVTVHYGADRAPSVTVSDGASVDRFGEHRLELVTLIASAADAEQRAAERLERAAWPRWTLEPIQLKVAPPGDFRIGRRVSIGSLPPSAPYAAWSPVLEGWVDRIDQAAFSMQLVTSDPVASGFFARWVDAGAATAWADLDPALAWAQATSPILIGG